MTRSATKTRTRRGPTAHAAQDRDAKIAALHAQITEGVEALVDSGAWKAMLDTAARFHTYSLGNQMLIALQAPAATRVAGFRTWQALGRQVRKGEKGIAILAPCTYRPKTETPDNAETPAATTPAATSGEDSPTPARRQLRGFRTAHVFAQEQTDGDELPTLGDAPAAGTVPAGLWDALAAQVSAHGYTVQRGDCGTADGYTDPATKTVRVTGSTHDAEAIGVLAHELAHIECGQWTTCPPTAPAGDAARWKPRAWATSSRRPTAWTAIPRRSATSPDGRTATWPPSAPPPKPSPPPLAPSSPAWTSTTALTQTHRNTLQIMTCNSCQHYP